MGGQDLESRDHPESELLTRSRFAKHLTLELDSKTQRSRRRRRLRVDGQDLEGTAYLRVTPSPCRSQFVNHHTLQLDLKTQRSSVCAWMARTSRAQRCFSLPQVQAVANSSTTYPATRHQNLKKVKLARLTCECTRRRVRAEGQLRWKGVEATACSPLPLTASCRTTLPTAKFRSLRLTITPSSLSSIRQPHVLRLDSLDWQDRRGRMCVPRALGRRTASWDGGIRVVMPRPHRRRVEHELDSSTAISFDSSSDFGKIAGGGGAVGASRIFLPTRHSQLVEPRRDSPSTIPVDATS